MKTRFKASLIALSFLASAGASAESLSCKAPGSPGFSLVARTSDPPTVARSLTAKLKPGRLRKSKTLTLKHAPRGASLNYVDYWNPEGFRLSLGSFRGEGTYPNATLTLDKGTPKERTVSLRCELERPDPFVDYCEASAANDPQANLFKAARAANADLLDATLACGLDVNVPDELGCTPLLALSDKRCGTGTFSPFAGADIKGMVRSLLEAGAHHEIDAEDPATGETALLKVVRIQDLASAERLLEAGADIDYRDMQGFTPLMRSVETGYLKMAEALIGRGADIAVTNFAGLSALDIAKQKGFRDFLPVLSVANTVLVESDARGACSMLSFDLKLGVPNRIIARTIHPMLMVEAAELGIYLMAAPGVEASTIVTPRAAGEFKMTCGPRMGGGNPEGVINVK